MSDATPRKARTGTLAALTVTIGLLAALLVVELAVRLLLPHQSPEAIRRHSIEYDASALAGYLLKPVDRLVEVDKGKAWGTKVGSKDVFALFPGNPSKQAGLIAGLPESRRKGGY